MAVDETRKPSPGESAPSKQSEDAPGEVMRYIAMVYQRRWLVLFVVAVFVLMTALQLKRATNIYIATSTIKYEPASLQYVDFGEVGRPVNAVDEIRTQIEIIRGPQITQQVIQALGLDQWREKQKPEEEEEAVEDAAVHHGPGPLAQLSRLGRNFNKNLRDYLVPAKEVRIPEEERRRQSMVRRIQGKVRVRQYEDTKLIDITVRDSDPRMAARIANAYAEEYQRSLNTNKSSSYDLVRDFFSNQIQQARLDLQAAQQELLNYSKKSGTDLQLIEQESELALNMTKSLRQQIEELKNEVALNQAREESGEKESIDAYLLSRDATYNSFVERIANLELDRVALIAELTENNPEVVRVDRQIESLREQLEEQVKLFTKQLTGEAILAEKKLEALKERLDEQEQKFNRLQALMVEYRPLTLNVETQQDVYDQLLSRSKEIDIAADVTPDNVTIHSYATVPTAPSEPKVSDELFNGGLMGLLFGGLLAIGLGLIDRSIHDPEEAIVSTGVPSLGVVPYMGGGVRVPGLRSRRRGPTPLISQFDPYSPQTEAFRLLRTGLQYSTAGGSPHAILVTSCMPAEGKSTISANLALSFAGLGEKTILVDSDLKLPNVHRVFGVSKTPGLTDFLTGQAKLDDLILKSKHDHLDILPAGPSSPSPVELLDSTMMSQLVDELRKRYDRVVLDAAPLHGMSDSYVLVTKCDGMCLVASLGRTRLDLVKEAVGNLRRMNARVLGMVFNNQSRRTVTARLYGYASASGGGYSTSYGKRGRRKYEKRREHKSDVVLKPETDQSS